MEHATRTNHRPPRREARTSERVLTKKLCSQALRAVQCFSRSTARCFVIVRGSTGGVVIESAVDSAGDAPSSFCSSSCHINQRNQLTVVTADQCCILIVDVFLLFIYGLCELRIKY